MSTSGTQIACRNCKEVIDTETGSCPHCGTSIRSDLPYAAAVVLGLVLMGAAAIAPGELLLFGIVGVAVAAGSGFLLYEKRQRVNQADERNA